ncbi:ABC transporter permease [Streptomyces sp. NPDC060031]|uniref:ABC transporter permease n=1 Tax=Streptomyces sp. NPDC060031 TaxID=3347043 RepID=UPI0036CE566A
MRPRGLPGLPGLSRIYGEGFRHQLRLTRRSLGDFQVLITVPLYTVVLLSMADHAGRVGLMPYAVLAPAFIAQWSMALFVAGDLVSQERQLGTLEAIVATPASLATLMVGRISAIVAVSLLAFGESVVVARVLFEVPISVGHPWILLAGIVAGAFAMAGTAGTMAALFVLARSARTFQNSLSYPFYLLGGILVPVAMLPDWLQPLSRLVFLSWEADLLRASMATGPVHHVPERLAAIVALGGLGYAVTILLMRSVLRRVRSLGTLGYA